LRAGKAAAESLMRRGGRKDENHREICGALREMFVGYIDLSEHGRGVPDLLVYCGGTYHLWEIKNPKSTYGRKGLNKNQREFASKWKGGPVNVIRTVDEAVAFVAAAGGSHGDSRTPRAIVTTAEQALKAVEAM
jgi:hypothetical protein